MDRKQREAARAKRNYFKKKEEAARTKALDEFLKREAPELLAKDDTQWMDDLPDLGPYLPELDSSLP